MWIGWRTRVGWVLGAGLLMDLAQTAAAICVPVAPGTLTARGYAAKGAASAGEGQPVCAVEMYRAAVKLEPANAEWVLGLAGAYDAAGQTERAGASLVAGVKAMPASARLTGGLVVFLARHGQLDQAYGVAERFAKLHPRDPEAQKVYLRVLVATGDAAGPPLAKRLLAAAPGDGELLYLNGVLERKAGEYAAARGHLEASVARTPEFADSRYNLGVVLARLGDNAGAKAQLEKAIALGITEPEAHLQLSKAMRALGDEAGAAAQLAVYQRAMQANAAKAIAVSKSAEAAQALEKGDAVQAVTLYREAAEAAPEDAALHYQLALALDKTGDTAGERAALEEAVKLDPASPLARHQLGYVLSRLGDNDKAEEQFRLAVRAKPDFTQAWISLAATMAMKSEFPEARDAVGHALKLEPRNAEALQMRRMLLASQTPH